MHERTLSARTVYRGRIVRLEMVDVELANGTRTQREIIRHAGAVVILPRLPDGRFLLVRQFRKPVERELLEMVAGTLERGEDPEACARREMEEETGYRARALRHMGTVYPSPGYIEERMEMYFAEADDARAHPRPDQDVVIEVVPLSRPEIQACIRRGEILDAKTLAGWLLYEKIVEAEDRGTP